MVIKPRKVIVEWILSAWNDISHAKPSEVIQILPLDGDENDQIHCFKPKENQFVPIFGDIAEATPSEMLIDEDEEIDVLL